MKPKTRSKTGRFQCLFCLKTCLEPTPLMDQVEIHGAVRCVELQKQLQQLFILRQLLDIPSTWCEEMLQREDGDSNPESWFRICRICNDTVKDAWKTYQKLLSVLEKMGVIKEQIKNMMLENLYKIKTRVGGADNEIRTMVFPDEMASLMEKEDELEQRNDIKTDIDGLSDYNPDSPLNQDEDQWEDEDEMEMDDEDDVAYDDVSVPPKSSRKNTNSRKRVRKKRSKERYWKMCRLCPSRYKYGEDFEAHLLAHEDSKKNEGKFDCQDCLFPARDANELEQHMFDKHLNPKLKIREYQCIKCDYHTNTWKDLRAHANEQHPDANEVELGVELTCKVCSKTCEGRSAFMLHMKKTHPESFGAETETLGCDQCSRRFPNKIVLQYHINNTHRRINKFICSECGRGFRYDKALQRHQITHNKGKREFVCHICGCEYAYKSVLEWHYRKFHPQTNTEGKDKTPGENDNEESGAADQEEFKCKYCDLTSPFRVIMIRHMQTHKAEMGFKCNLCQKFYVNIQGLKRHKRINHPTTAEEYKCPYCFKAFNSIDYMKNHTSKYCKVRLLEEKTTTESSEAPNDEMMIDLVPHFKNDPTYPSQIISMPLITAELTEQFKVSTENIP